MTQLSRSENDKYICLFLFKEKCLFFTFFIIFSSNRGHKKSPAGNQNVNVQMQQRMWTPWPVIRCPHIASVSWYGPNRLTAFCLLAPRGNIRIAYAFGKSPHPHSSAMCSQAAPLPPPPSPLPLRSDTKTVAHFALHGKEKDLALFISPWTRGALKHKLCHFLSWLSSPRYSIYACRLCRFVKFLALDSRYLQ